MAGSEREDYLLALYTSPRRRGNTSLLLDALVEEAKGNGIEVVSFHVPRMDIRPCRGCNACSRDGECIQEDEMGLVYPHLRRARWVVLAAPVFSMHLCAQAKILVDRCQPFWALRYVLKRDLVPPEVERYRRGLLISCCGRDVPETFENLKPTLSYFFHVLRVGAWDQLVFPGVDAAGDILKVEGALDQARKWASEQLGIPTAGGQGTLAE